MHLVDLNRIYPALCQDLSPNSCVAACTAPLHAISTRIQVSGRVEGILAVAWDVQGQNEYPARTVRGEEEEEQEADAAEEDKHEEDDYDKKNKEEEAEAEEEEQEEDDDEEKEEDDEEEETEEERNGKGRG